MELTGLLVDLVPYGDKFLAREHHWLNGPAVFYWAVGGRWIVPKTEIKAMQQERRDERDQGDARQLWGVQTKDGTPIGLFGVNWVFEPSRLASLTASIGEPDYWGGGYGTDALLLLVDHVFNWWDMRKAWLHTMGLNVRVQRQMHKVGFTLEGRARQATYADGAWVDILTYGLLRDEWLGYEALVEKLKLRDRSKG
jgi:RimJ/RimL family protein N-acetyltransferase